YGSAASTPSTFAWQVAHTSAARSASSATGFVTSQGSPTTAWSDPGPWHRSHVTPSLSQRPFAVPASAVSVTPPSFSGTREKPLTWQGRHRASADSAGSQDGERSSPASSNHDSECQGTRRATASGHGSRKGSA